MRRLPNKHARRSFWTPTRFEFAICVLLVALWLAGIVVVIRHEQAGLWLSAAYVLLSIIGACISWLLVWPLLRILIHAMGNE